MLKKLFLLPLFLFCLSIFTYAWNKPGHMVTGAIAYQVLKEKDETALKTVLELLKKHNYYSEWVKTMDSENIPDAYSVENEQCLRVNLNT